MIVIHSKNPLNYFKTPILIITTYINTTILTIISISTFLKFSQSTPQPFSLNLAIAQLDAIHKPVLEPPISFGSP